MLYLGQAFRQWRFRWDSIAWRTLPVGEQLLKFLSLASRSYMYFVVLVTNVIVSLLAKASCVARSIDRSTTVYIKCSSLLPTHLFFFLTHPSVFIHQKVNCVQFMACPLSPKHLPDFV